MFAVGLLQMLLVLPIAVMVLFNPIVTYANGFAIGCKSTNISIPLFILKLLYWNIFEKQAKNISAHLHQKLAVSNFLHLPCRACHRCGLQQFVLAG
jgi:hypothetical protein